MAIRISKSEEWGLVRVAPQIKALVTSAAAMSGQSQTVVMDILLKTGGYNSKLTATALAKRVNRAAAKALLYERGLGVGGDNGD